MRGEETARPEAPLHEPERPGPSTREKSTLDFGRIVLIFVSVTLPNVVLVVALSGLGEGLQVFNSVAKYSLYGDFLFIGAAFLCALLWVCNWPNWKNTLRVVTLILPWATGVAGTMLKGRKYPWGPVAMCMFMIILLLGALRAGPCKKSRRVYFYRVTYMSTFFWAIIMCALWVGWVRGGLMWDDALKEDWASLSDPLYENAYSVRALNYTNDCGPSKNVSGLATEIRSDVKSACAAASQVLFMVWASPCIGAICNAVLSLFVFLIGAATHYDDRVLERDLKKFVLFIVAMLAGMYASSYAAGTSMRFGSTLMAFFAAGLAGLAGWLILEMGIQVIVQSVFRSRFAGLVQQGASSEWVQALAVGAVNILIPVFFCLEKCRQFFVSVVGKPRQGSRYEADSWTGDRDMVTEHMQQVIRHLSAFNWVGILLKICVLGELFFVLQVGVAKAVYVFLSWMLDFLDSYSFGLTIGISLSVGFVMFLLPPVPGVPVYVFCGVVVSAKAANMDSIGFVGGVLISMALAWSLKLIACCGQYLIGYFLGKSIKVQQLVHVDKVITRAIQMILSRRGLDLGKVAVLVGGPDWPVSVTCGILRLDIPQMLLGTAPVIVTLAPCCLAGAFLTRVTGSGGSIENILSNAFMTAAVGVQIVSMFSAVYFITKVVDKHGTELAKPRPEHQAVEELTKQELAYNLTYAKVTAWPALHPFRKMLLTVAAGMMLLSGFVFVFFDEMCFQNFAVSSRIQDPLDENGLDGNVVNLVKMPVGWGALGLFAMACLLHLIVLQDLTCLAKSEHKKNPASSGPRHRGEASPAADGRGLFVI